MTTQTIDNHNRRIKLNLIKEERHPYITCNWVNFVFIHYEVNAELLQAQTPYTILLYEDKAYVSLVAFTLEKFRFAPFGPLNQIMTKPIETHHYFNVRTYVEHQGQEGIYFIKEWISNRLCATIGTWMYGLPCQFGYLDYQHQYLLGKLNGTVAPSGMKGEYTYEIKMDYPNGLEYVHPDSLDEFLLERYVAYVQGNRQGKYFRIWHKPWMQAAIDVTHINDNLLAQIGPWGEAPKLVKAHYSPGVYGVWMGKPQSCEVNR